MKYLIVSLQVGGLLYAIVTYAAHQPCWEVLVGFGIHGVGDYFYIRKNGGL